MKKKLDKGEILLKNARIDLIKEAYILEIYQ